MPSGTQPSPSTPHAGLTRTTRLVGGLLLLMVMGASIGPETSGRWSHSAREHAAQELAGARRAGERVAKAIWTFVGRHAVESPAATAQVLIDPSPASTLAISPAPVRTAGVELDVWLLDLPPPACA
ncbi:MAG: hypothetical protein RIB60_09265 [Phycisphaerales bacterium]